MSFCLRLRPGMNAGRLGGKARSLLRLATAGLAVPEALVVTSELFAALRAGGPPLPTELPRARALEAGTLAAIGTVAAALGAQAWPTGFVEELGVGLHDLDPSPGARFAVRSSAAVEDQAGALAAGLFLSRLDVPRDAVPEAVRAVLASAVAPAAVVYLTRRGLTIDALGFSVLIHPFVGGDAAGSAALDPTSPSLPNLPLIDLHFGDDRAARGPLLSALRQLAAAHGAVEVEWVATGDRPTFLQLRPYRATPRAARAGGDDPNGPWRWDAAHNPLPLSPAQAGLVALVDARCRTAFRQRVTGGYLFYADDPTFPIFPTFPTFAARPPSADGPGADPFTELKALAETRLGVPAPSLERALETFAAIYGPLFGVVQPVARAAQAALDGFLRSHGLDPAPLFRALRATVPSAALERQRRAEAVVSAPDAPTRAAALEAYLEAFGDESPAWDVEAPTWREDPEALQRRLRDRRPRAEPDADRRVESPIDRIGAALPPIARGEWTRLLAAARRAVATGEDDDALYARAQAHVRRALLREGARLAAEGRLARAAEVFWLPLDLVRASARAEIAPSRGELAKLVEAARTADRAGRAHPPALLRAPVAGETPDLIRGRSGAGGAFIGRVRLALDTESVDAAAEVLVARTILPTELPLVAAAALVIETGGPLDHVAAQARERGIPAVVGAAGACARLRAGDRVLVDGDAGVVLKLDDIA
jgi:phosphohistidine swiveling domain-containing protein